MGLTEEDLATRAGTTVERLRELIALVTAVCCALIAWDVIHYREDRAEVRRARP